MDPTQIQQPEQQANVLGDTAKVEFSAVNHAQPIQGKIDTGATTSSMDADWYEADTKNGKVTFTSKLFGDAKITMDMEGTQTVQTAAGSEVRPVIKLDVKINDIPVKDALFNLNDRKGMAPILIGQNILKAGNFVIDPNKDQHEVAPEDTVQPVGAQEVPKVESEQIRKALEVLRESNITLADIIRYLKTEVVQSIKD